MLIKIFFLFLFLASQGYSQTDLTLKDKAVGVSVVEAVISKIENTCIFPNDKLFLRRISYVETMDGTNPNTFPPNYFGGIWKVDEDKFNKTKQASSNFINSIATNFNIQWGSVNWRDLTKPLYSGLAAYLYLISIDINFPISLKDQADLWVKNYRPGGKAETFENLITNFEKNCKGIVDLCFVFDSSGSIGSINFQIMKNFSKVLIEKLGVGTTNFASRVSMIRYSSSFDTIFNFINYSSVAQYHTAIDNMPYIGGGTNTDVALNFVAKNVFIPSFGARSSVPKVAVVVTDGASSDRQATIQAANLMQSNNIINYAIGVGSGVNNIELEAIASDPDCRSLFLLKNFQEFDSLIQSIQKRICESSNVVGNDTEVPSNDGTPITINSSSCLTELSTSTGKATIYYSKSYSPSPAYYEGKVNVSAGSVAFIKYDAPPLYIYVETPSQILLTIKFSKSCSEPCQTINCPPNNFCQPLKGFTYRCAPFVNVTITSNPVTDNCNPVTQGPMKPNYPWYWPFPHFPHPQPRPPPPHYPRYPHYPNYTPCPKGNFWFWYSWIYNCY